MELWIKEIMNSIDRKKAQILFSEHAAKDKNLGIDESEEVNKGRATDANPYTP